VQRDNAAFNSEVRKVLARTVGEAMTTDVVTVAPSATLQDAAALMLRKKARASLMHTHTHTHICISVLTHRSLAATLCR
jgi:CBS domain-containing protein